MSFSPEETLEYGSRPSEGGAPACRPPNVNLWGKKRLVVKLCNEKYLKKWKITPEMFLECANRWSTGDVDGGNYIPKFEFKVDKSPPDIIVELNGKTMY